MKSVTAREQREIGQILDYVHDRAFRLSSIRFDENARILTIPLSVISDEVRGLRTFAWVKVWKNPVVESTLRIRTVQRYAIKDEAEIDGGLINTIKYEDGNVIIKSSVPVEIVAQAANLDIELQISDVVVSERTRFAFGC